MLFNSVMTTANVHIDAHVRPTQILHPLQHPVSTHVAVYTHSFETMVARRRLQRQTASAVRIQTQIGTILCRMQLTMRGMDDWRPSLVRLSFVV